VVGVEDHGGYTDRTKTERDGTQENVNGSDQPESKQVKIFIAILALGRIVIGLVLFVDPNGACNDATRNVPTPKKRAFVTYQL
jgi:hypothetical protein